MKKVIQWGLASFLLLKLSMCLGVCSDQYEEKWPVQIAYQNVGLDKEIEQKHCGLYVMPLPKANNALSESMAEAYEKKIALSTYVVGSSLGYTSGQEAYATLLRSRGDSSIQSLGYDRGTLVQEAAFTILAGRETREIKIYKNRYLMIRGVGWPDNASSYNAKAIAVIGEKNKNNVTYHYFTNDVTK